MEAARSELATASQRRSEEESRWADVSERLSHAVQAAEEARSGAVEAETRRSTLSTQYVE